MPTFDFRCTGCSAVFEETLPFGSKKLPICPHCGKKKTEKLLTMPSISFKGTGFYKTDSQKKAAETTVKPAEKAKETPKPSTPTDSQSK